MQYQHLWPIRIENMVLNLPGTAESEWWANEQWPLRPRFSRSHAHHNGDLPDSDRQFFLACFCLTRVIAHPKLRWVVRTRSGGKVRLFYEVWKVRRVQRTNHWHFSIILMLICHHTQKCMILIPCKLNFDFWWTINYEIKKTRFLTIKFKTYRTINNFIY